MTVLVNNEAGVLARVVGLFSGRGYNIESLTVAEVDPAAHTSRITIVTSGTPLVIEQIEAQLGRLVPVRSVINWTAARAGIEREMALIKEWQAPATFSAWKRCASADCLSCPRQWKAFGHASFCGVRDPPAHRSQISDSSFIEQMRPLGLVDVSRTGVAAISRGPEAM